MRSLILGLLFLAIVMGIDRFGFSQGSDSTQTASTKLFFLEQKLRRLKANHAEMVSKQEEIKQELANLKIWVQHRP